MGLMVSPLRGANGNVEFFLHCRPGTESTAPQHSDRRCRQRGPRIGAVMSVISMMLHPERSDSHRLATQLADDLIGEGNRRSLERNRSYSYRQTRTRLRP